MPHPGTRHSGSVSATSKTEDGFFSMAHYQAKGLEDDFWVNAVGEMIDLGVFEDQRQSSPF
jgi:hypothetical protein